MTGGSSGPIVGYDSDRVIDDSTNNKIGILSHEGTDATDRPYQGDCDRQSVLSGVKTREKVQNKANPESTQSLESQELKPETAGAGGRNKAKVPRGRRAESRGRAMADRLGRVAGGRWTVKPKRAR